MGWKDKAEEYWKSIEDDHKKKRWLGRHITWDAGDLADMSVEQVRETFPNRPEKGTVKPGVDDAQVTRTHIWQCWNKIRSGEMAPINGNLRSFWYREYEPLYVRLGMLDKHWTDSPDPERLAKVLDLPSERWTLLMEKASHNLSLLKRRHEQKAVKYLASRNGRPSYLLNLMTRSIDQFVIHRIFHFQDEFEFHDPRQNFRKVGKVRARILFCTEKEGLYQLVLGFANKHGISAMASHGESHWVSMSYMADDLEKNGVAHIILGALTDYDPWGYTIAENFLTKFEEFGFTVELTHLTTVDLFTPEQLKKGKRDFASMSDPKQKQAKKWFKDTHGIHGEMAGIHVDLASWPTIEAAAEKWLDSLGKPKHP